MKFIIATLFATGFLVTVCRAGCFGEYPKVKSPEEKHPKGCFYNGTLYELKSMWKTENCFKCTCNSRGYLRCCNIGGTLYYDTRKCIATFNKDTCYYTIHQNPESSEPCEGHAMAGVG